MAKLVLRESSYTGIKNIKKCKISNSPEHEKLVKEAKERIEKNKTGYAAAYKNAGYYLGQ